jgi:hypothetical protein
MSRPVRYRGVFPVVPTIFDESGALDLPGQRRAVDCMIDAGSTGLCILANFSEQFVLSDDERGLLTRAILEHVAGRVPVIVTTTHFSQRVCAARSREAQEMGAAMVMVMPPYHGATIRVAEPGIAGFFQAVSDAIDIPIMIQDAPVSGTALPARFLAGLAREIEHVAYFKIEVPMAAAKLRELIALGGDAIEGPWDGEEAITLMADLDAVRGDDRRRVPGRHPPDRRRPCQGRPRRRRGRLRALAAADQLREPPMRPAGGEGADAGRRRDRQRRAARAAGAAASGDPRRPAGDRGAARPGGAALGALKVDPRPDRRPGKARFTASSA